jgi:hypothetical protein
MGFMVNNKLCRCLLLLVSKRVSVIFVSQNLEDRDVQNNVAVLCRRESLLMEEHVFENYVSMKCLDRDGLKQMSGSGYYITISFIIYTGPFCS